MKTSARRLMAVLLAMSIAFPGPGYAGLIGTDRSEPHRAARDRLIEYGVDPRQAEGRAAALTDEEAADLAARIDALPAGGNSDGWALIVLVAFFAPELLVIGAVVLVAAAIANRGNSSRPIAPADTRVEPGWPRQ